MNDDRDEIINENGPENDVKAQGEDTPAVNADIQAEETDSGAQGADNIIKAEESSDAGYSDDARINESQQAYGTYNFEATPSDDGKPDTDMKNDFNDTQKVDQVQNFQNNFNHPNLNGPSVNNYYRESYKKTNTKKSDTWKYVLVSVVSSIVGAAVLAVILLVVAPVVQPQIKDFLSGTFPNLKTESAQPSTGELKRVEIVQNGASAITSVAEKVGPSVVGIRTTYQNTNDLFGVQSDGGEGSGIIISSDGYILTNHHVVENALNDKTRDIKSGAKIQVYLPNKIDKPYIATIKGYDSKTDLAVLKINEKNLPAIEFGNSDELKVGEPAIAIGNPGGLEYMGSVTSGVISGLNRTVQLDGGKKIRLVQTDAAINPGNSGGALVNIKGQLIGINTVKMVATGFEGLGFAIPVNEAKTISDELVKNTYIAKPYLGISVDQRYTEDIAKANNMPMGVYVADVEMLGAAQKAGIKPGDIITKFNNKTVSSYDELEEIKNKFKPGDSVKVEIYRDTDKSTKTMEIKLGETK